MWDAFVLGSGVRDQYRRVYSSEFTSVGFSILKGAWNTVDACDVVVERRPLEYCSRCSNSMLKRTITDNNCSAKVEGFCKVVSIVFDVYAFDRPVGRFWQLFKCFIEGGGWGMDGSVKG